MVNSKLIKLFYSTTLLILFSCSSKTVVIEKKFGTDAHLHIHDPQESADDIQFTGDRALLAIDSIDLKRGIVLSMAYNKGVSKEKARKENHFVAQEVKKYFSIFTGACGINPMVPWAMEELHACHDEDLKLVKLHTVASGMDLKKTDDLNHLKIILEEADKFHKTILIHGHFFKKMFNDKQNEADILLRTLEQYPHLNIIIGHMLGRDYELLAGFHHPQFFVEISGLPMWVRKADEREKLVGVMRTVGIDKFIFGSDWPVFHPAEMLKALKELPLTAEEINQIQFTNAEKLNYLF